MAVQDQRRYGLVKDKTGQRVLTVNGHRMVTLNRAPGYEPGCGLDTPEGKESFAQSLTARLNFSNVLENRYEKLLTLRSQDHFLSCLGFIGFALVGFIVGALT